MEIIDEQQLANGMTVKVYDQSKKIAGDRWLVKIFCEATIPVAEDFFSRLAEADTALLSAVREKMAGFMSFGVAKEKNFIDAAEKDSALRAMVEQVSANMLAYLANQKFPEKLFVRRYEELKAACQIERYYSSISAAEDDDDGPADFSSCFKD